MTLPILPPATCSDDAMPFLASTAREVFEQIGFPQRPSFLTSMMHSLNRDQDRAEVDRLHTALAMLFDVAAQVGAERLEAGVAPQHAAPVLMFDNAEVLIRCPAIAAAGGR